MATTDFGREIYEPLRKNTDQLKKYSNERNGIIQNYGDVDANKIMSMSGQGLSPYQNQIVQSNPNMQRDLSRMSALDQMTNRLMQQKAMLENDYMQLYGQAIGDTNKLGRNVEGQTNEMLRGSALSQVRDQGFAMGQATKRGDSQAMKGKIQSDINAAGQQQRSQINAQQDEKMLQADSVKTQTLLSIASQLQQQQQQDLQNKIQAEQLAAANAPSSRATGRGTAPAGYMWEDYNGQRILRKLETQKEMNDRNVYSSLMNRQTLGPVK